MPRIFSVIGGVFLLLGAACSQPSAPPPADPLYDRGRAVYYSQCIACHASNPSQEGPVGPAIDGSSRELLTARLLQAGYPPGYDPKRSTHVMPAMPHLEKEIDALARFLRPPQ